MDKLKKYINKYRNIVNGAIDQRAAAPVWNKEMVYSYNTSSDKVNSEIEGETATIQVQLTYPENIDWDYCKHNDYYKKNVSEVHTFKLTFGQFGVASIMTSDDPPPKPSADFTYIDRRNITGTYTKDVNATVLVRDTAGNISTKTYIDTLSGVFKSYDFDYKCFNNYTGTNQSLAGKNICFIDEEFISTTDELADPHENNDEPNYSLFFTPNYCQVHLFTTNEEVNKYKNDKRYNNKPGDEFTCVWFDGIKDGMKIDAVRAIHGKKINSHAAELTINDIREVYDFDRDSTFYIEFDSNSNKGNAKAHDCDVTATFVFKYADQSKQVKSIDDIDFNNLQNYIISSKFYRELTEDTVEFDMVPGFIFDGTYL